MSDEHVMRYLAHQYRFDDLRLSGLECCAHNRRVVVQLGLLQRAAVWAALEVIVPQVSGKVSVLPLSRRLLSNLLSELLDNGDCQLFVVCIEILRKDRCLEGVTISRLQEGYLAYTGIAYTHSLTANFM
jgi:hypothetical protein